MRRKEALANGEIYHVFNRSIADYKVFNDENDFLRIKRLLQYFRLENMSIKFSHFIDQDRVKENGFEEYLSATCQDKEAIVQIITYCVMPTHLHLILKQTKDNGVSLFMGNILNSYARYFNTRHGRKGPLWEGKFKNVHVESDEQLLHLTRYVHLNPVTAYLVDKPEKWATSSYEEYLLKQDLTKSICSYSDVLKIDPKEYQKFVDDRIDYQRELALIKNLTID